MDDHQIFDLGTVVLQSGATLRDARLAYKTFGTLNRDDSNVILFPTAFGGRHTDNEWLIGEGMALDPTRYFIVIPNLLGNGLSSSPSNTPPPYDKARFPDVTIYDNVRCQMRLMTEVFDVESIKLVIGRSMGALQAFQWASLYPEMVERILPFGGAARCSRHNFVFLEGAKAALRADAAWNDGWYERPPTKGLRAMARVWAGWGLSQAFYRAHLDIHALGHSSLEDFLIAFWEGDFLTKDANDLLAMLWTWQHADISANDVYNGDFERTLGAIKADAIVMPSQTDLYFPPEDSAYEVSHMPKAELRPIPSIWGHFAGGPGAHQEDITLIDDALKELLAR
ncbi:alpha/beta fold hydrolase [Rhodospirillaceae bacterium SYSU D60014]|uniref:alpha/beta fold hydrolase n=1 Tax=Virgifigura deserti TaxID=2268457 RepID=UPI000E66DA30